MATGANNMLYGRVEDNKMARQWAKQPQQHVQLGDKVYCHGHFEDKYPTLFNYMYVNYPTLQGAFGARFVYWLDNDEVIHCDVCKLQFNVPDSDQKDWTQAWAEVGMVVGFTVADDGFMLDETELRHQCYIILGRYHIKASDYKAQVRSLIRLAKEIKRVKLGA